MREESVERFIAVAERMHLEDYVRFQSDRKRRLLDAFTEVKEAVIPENSLFKEFYK